MSNDQMIPPAWNYNPSSWGQRIPLIIVGSVGFCIAMYLAFYQLHLVDNVWDPFFGDGTEKVLTSKISQKFPIPDALLGAFGYLLDVVTGIIGGTNRWKNQAVGSYRLRACGWTTRISQYFISNITACNSWILVYALSLFRNYLSDHDQSCNG